jgi:2-polyprenyl-6-methoxyphenol hydroxylase-like FAD-dependent oxidoreductase
MTNTYDVIVVGARCAGSPTAMLLARAGHRVLLVDRATFPSDTMSTHLLHPPAVAALERWGLLERLQATGCPPVTTYSFDFGPVTISGSPLAGGEPATAYGPRRIVLDALLADAAAAAGAELREGFTVQDVLVEEGRVTGIRGRTADGRTVTEHARVVIGADGRTSSVARAVQPERYHEVPRLCAVYYAYWSGLPTRGFETYVRPEHGRGWAALPTNDGLTCLVVGWPRDEFEANRSDVEGAYLASFAKVPEFAERIGAARRETRFVGTGELPGFFRKPFGPGWILVGDAGYHKHPITAFGITDAFRDAEAVAAALGDDDALGEWQRTRDETSMPMYELTAEFARLEPPEPQMQALFAAMQGNQEAMDGFVSVMAGTLPPPEFFAPDNLGRIMAGAAA